MIFDTLRTADLYLLDLTIEKLRRRQWHPTPVLLPGKIPWIEEPGGPQSMGSLRVGQNSATSLSLFTFMHWRRKWQPTPVFLPGESQGREGWWAAVCRVAQSRTRLKQLAAAAAAAAAAATHWPLFCSKTHALCLQHPCLQSGLIRSLFRHST